VEIECTTGAEVARAIRELAVRGGPAIAQVAAYGLALTADRARSAKPYVRLATVRGTANALAHARIAPAAPRAAVDRLMARMSTVGELVDTGDEIADAMRAEADAIAFETTLDNARLVDAGRTALEDLVRAAEAAAAAMSAPEEAPTAAERALGVLTLGSSGALAGGQVGTALAVLASFAGSGRPTHVFVLETRPSLDGARLAAWELAQAAVPFSILADGAAGWILASGEVDVVIVAADRVARDGSFLAPIGTLGVAVAAASAGVPVWVCATGSALDPGADGVDDLPEETRTANDLLRIRGLDVAAPGSTARNPIVDATPGELVSLFVTDAGVFQPPFAVELAALAAAFASRSPVPADPVRGGGTAGATATARPEVSRAGDSPAGGALEDPGSAEGTAS
jgi:methylthioribose-1-phosphate isomerase